MKKYLLGLDAGTTSFKAALFDLQGALIDTAFVDYTLRTPATDWVEFPPQMYFDALCELTKALLLKTAVSPNEIIATAISSQGETLICLDEYGKPLMNAIVWLDNRSVSQADRLRERFGKREIYERTGQADMMPTWPAAKILWLKENEPEVFRKTSKFLLLEDYLIYRLTGRFAGEPNLYCSSAYYDIIADCWWKDMLVEIGVDETRLPEIVPCGSPIGHVTREAGEMSGLDVNTCVCAGALDQTCGCIGAGLTLPGTVAETTGSCLAVSANLDRFVPFNESIPLTCQNHAVPGRFVMLLWSQTAGMVFKWFANGFYDAERIGLDDAFAIMNDDAKSVPAGCDGLIMLPHLSGASNPEYDANAKGVFYGATLMHAKPHFTRAIMEAVAFMLRRNIEQISAHAQPFDVVYAMGGAAKSPLWLQIKADVAGKTFKPLSVTESACRGAAVLAGVGAGVYSDIDSAAESLCKTNGEYLPDNLNRPVYNDVYRDYIALYENLAPFFSSHRR